MAIPTDPDARLFYRAAEQRREDAALLFGQSRNAAAVYLAGYTVECLLKSLLLSATPPASRPAVLASFRGSGGHDLLRLRLRYRRVAPAEPRSITLHLETLESWSVALRYNPREVRVREAKDFLAAVEAVWDWAGERLS